MNGRLIAELLPYPADNRAYPPHGQSKISEGPQIILIPQHTEGDGLYIHPKLFWLRRQGTVQEPTAISGLWGGLPAPFHCQLPHQRHHFFCSRRLQWAQEGTAWSPCLYLRPWIWLEWRYQSLTASLLQYKAPCTWPAVWGLMAQECLPIFQPGVHSLQQPLPQRERQQGLHAYSTSRPCGTLQEAAISGYTVSTARGDLSSELQLLILLWPCLTS